MNCNEDIEILFTTTSFILAVIDLIWTARLSRKSNRISEDAAKAQQAAVEIQLKQEIDRTYAEVQRWMDTVAYCNDECSEEVTDHLDLAVADYRNAYENACSKYLHGMVNAEDFESMYKEDIKRLVTDKEHKKYYQKWDTEYKNTREVYEMRCK